MPEQGLDDNLAASGIDDAALDAKKLVEKIEKDCTPAERKLLEMKKQGLSTEEMAAEIGCSDTAVRKRLSRLFNKIRERWGDATTGSAGESSSSNSEA